MEFLARHYDDILLDYRFNNNNDLYSKNKQFRLLSIRQKFPVFDSRLNQMQGVHLEVQKFKLIDCVFLTSFISKKKLPDGQYLRRAYRELKN